MYKTELLEFQKNALVFDIHVHDQSLFPAIFRSIYALVLRKSIPPFRSLGVCRVGGVDGAMVAPVGDGVINYKDPSRPNLKPVFKNLEKIMASIKSSGGTMVVTTDELIKAKKEGLLAFILALEGGNALGDDMDNLDALYSQGVRSVTLVHFGDNALGTVETSALDYWKNGDRKKQTRGLTPLGETAVRRMNSLGMIIDLAHADRETIQDVARLSNRPVIASHTGARALSDFKRYIYDEEIKAIASTGGLIGLWPFFFWGKGMPDVGSFIDHARHIHKLVGEDHLAIGTDAHGIPGFMRGYYGTADALVLTQALFEAGFKEVQVRKILGLNFARVLRENEQVR